MYIKERRHVLTIVYVNMCLSEKQLKQSWNQAIESTKEYGHEKKEDLVRETKAVLSDAKSELQALDRKAAKATGTAKQKIEKEMQSLRKDIQRAEGELVELKNSSAEHWNTARRKIGNALDSIVIGFSKAWKEIKD